jgi:hypothetical protein
MKITKAKLKQIIKEELEVTLTNEEATEMFGEAVGTQLEEQELNEIDPSMMSEADKIALIVTALGKMAYNFSPAVFGTIAIMAARRAMGLDKPEEIEQVVQKTAAEMQPELKDIPWGTPPKQDYEKIDEMQGHPGKCCDTAHPDEDHEDYMARITIRLAEEEEVDVARAGAKLGKASGIEAAMAAINTRPEFEQMLMQFIQMVAKEKLKPQDVKMGVRNVAKQILKSK